MSDYVPMPYARRVETDADVYRQLAVTCGTIVTAYDARDGKRLDAHVETVRVLLSMLNSPRDGDMRGGDTVRGAGRMES